jgi:hypothetical protein
LEHDAIMDADAEVNRRQASAAVVVPVREEACDVLGPV